MYIHKPNTKSTWRNTALAVSLLLNAALLSLGIWALQRAGGAAAAWGRLHNNLPAMYEHRKTLFETLPVRPGAVIFLGDSQTEQAEWQELRPDSLPVLNRGISADYVIGIRSRLDEVLRHQPSAIYLQVGINDLIFGKSPQEIALVYREIVQKIRATQPGVTLVIQSVFPVNNDIRPIGVDNIRIRELNGLLRQIADENATPYADVYPALCDEAGRLSAQYTLDGIHLNGRGYAIWNTILKQNSR